MKTSIPLLSGGTLTGRARMISFDLMTGLMTVVSKGQRETGTVGTRPGSIRPDKTPTPPGKTRRTPTLPQEAP